MARSRFLEDSSFACNPLEEVADGSARKEHEHLYLELSTLLIVTIF